MTVASAVWLTLLTPATADDLTDRRKQIAKQISQTKHELSESIRRPEAAGVEVARTQAQLDVAEAKLRKTQSELAVAKAKDTAAAAKLQQGPGATCRKAKAAVRAGQRELDAQEAMAGRLVRDQYQQQSNLMPVALLVGASSPEDLQTRLQWSTTMFDTAQAEIVELTRIQRKLEAAKARQAALEKQVAADRRKAAAENLELRKALEARAATEQASVASAAPPARGPAGGGGRRRGRRQGALRPAAAGARVGGAADRDPDRQGQGRGGARRPEPRRGRGPRAAAARERAAKRAAAEARRAEQRAKAARGAKQRAKAAKARAGRPSRRARAARAAGEGVVGLQQCSAVQPRLLLPGARADHLAVRTPVPPDPALLEAARRHRLPRRLRRQRSGRPYSGRVEEKYYNGGYGNRLMIDHGYVRGKYVTTGYNHAIRYTVRVGQRVRKGQVIGYVGSTGYSTGCHLHLMVWLNGRVINPMRWF